MKFHYTVYTADNRLVKGKLNAENEKAAVNILNYADYYLVSVKPDTKFFDYERFLSIFYHIDAREIIRFGRQLALLLESGADIITSLRLLGQQIANRALMNAINRVITDIRGGISLSAAFMKHPQIFSEIFCKTIEAGENAGSLEIALKNVADYMEKQENARKKIKNALFYPVIVAVVAILVLFVLLYFVFPQFATLYEGLNATPPIPMQILMGTSDWLVKYGHYAIVGIIAFIIIAFAYIRTKNGKYKWHQLLLKLPVIGRIILLNQLARCCQVMALLFRVGISATEVLRTAVRNSTNTVLAEALNEVQQEVTGGSSLSAPMSRRKLFLPIMVQMVAAGEEAGNLNDTLSTTAETFTIEAEDITNTAIEFIQPAMTLALGALIGFIGVSVVSTIYSLYSSIG